MHCNRRSYVWIVFHYTVCQWNVSISSVLDDCQSCLYDVYDVFHGTIPDSCMYSYIESYMCDMFNVPCRAIYIDTMFRDDKYWMYSVRCVRCKLDTDRVLRCNGGFVCVQL